MGDFFQGASRNDFKPKSKARPNFFMICWLFLLVKPIKIVVCVSFLFRNRLQLQLLVKIWLNSSKIVDFFHVSTIFVYLYLQYIYTFQPQDFVNVQNSTLRKKCLIWKFLLTLIILLLSILCPLEKQPIPFQLLSKGQKYDRWVELACLISNL